MDPDIVRTEDLPQWAQDIVAWIHELPPQPPIQKWIKIRATQAARVAGLEQLKADAQRTDVNDFPDINTTEEAEAHFRRLGVRIVEPDEITVID